MTRWADQIYFKSAIDAEKVGGIGILHNDNSVPQKIYLGYGREPWDNGLTLDNNGDAILKGKISVNQILNRNPFAVLATSGDGTQAIECGTGETDVYIHNKKINTYLQMKNDNTIQYNNQKIYHEGFKPTAKDVNAVAVTLPSVNGGWVDAPLMANKRYFGGYHAMTSENGFMSFGATGVYKLDMFIDGDYFAQERYKVYHEGFKPTPAAIGAKATEPTSFSLQESYVAVRTPTRKPSQYYEFWDREQGWADIHSGNLYIKNEFSIEFNADNNAIEFIAL